MTRLASFTVTDVPIGGGLPPARRFVLSCPHGETSVTHLFGPPPAHEAVLVLLRARHERAEKCGCAASVARKETRA